MTNRQEYMKAWKEAHKESEKAKLKAWKEANKERVKAWCEANKEHVKAYMKAWCEANKEHVKAYNRSDINSLGQTKESIRRKSRYYLNKYGTKIPGYQIHHCCTYTEPYKFVYCSKEMHLLIHAYLKQHNIDADSDHYDLIKHLLDDRVVLYGIEM